MDGPSILRHTMRAFHFQQAEIRGISATVDKGLRFSVVTGECPDEARAAFFPLQGTNISLFIEPHEKDEGDEAIVVDTEVEKKTLSQRIRGALYRLWEQQGKPGTWREYYDKNMTMILDRIKAKLEPDA